MIRRLDILDRLHARLLEIVGTGLRLIPSSMEDGDLVGLAHLRAEMMAAIDAYARYVHVHVFDAALESGDVERLRLAREIKVGCIALEQAYRGFTARWAHDGQLNWPEYRMQAVVMMEQIRDQERSAARWAAVAAPAG